MTLKEKLQECRRTGKALLATNFYNYETLSAVLQAAHATGSPVILQLTKSSIDYMGLGMAVDMGRRGLADYGLQGWIHLDHGGSVELVRRCLDAGFDSVMIDASEEPFEKNVETTAEVVRMAAPYGANVEAELGFVAKLGQQQAGGAAAGFTTAVDAARFVDSTGVDALAIAIGSAHGFYKEAPKLDIVRLGEIAAAVDIPLVLHGSSGIPGEMVQEAIRGGICKVNLATEIKNAFMKNLKGILLTEESIDLRTVFPRAVEPVVELLTEKYRMIRNA
ncbi:MAG: class II fructose-bisphosphate aldolase [Alistipes sp.]|nr:class II fructose-bisphosphate aldolase [Alistipes sp.]